MNLFGRSGRTAVLVLMVVAAGCGGQRDESMEMGPIITVTSAGGSAPTTAYDPATGTTYVAWIGSESGAYAVYLARSEGGGSFDAPVRVNNEHNDAAPHDQAPPQVGLGLSGEVFVVWQNSTPIEGRPFPASNLRFAVSRDGGRTFSSAIDVNDDAASGPPSSHTFHNTSLAADGSLVVAWIDARDQDRPAAMPMGGSEMPDTTSDIRFARSTDGGLTFSPGQIVDEEPCPCCRTAVAVGPDGSIYVAWRKIFAGDVRDIVVARATGPEGPFDAPVKVSGDEWVYPGCPHAGPSLIADSDGRLHVGWYTGKEDRQGLWYASSADGGRSFTDPQPVQTGGYVPPSRISLTVVQGKVLMMWEDRSREDAAVQGAVVSEDGKPVLLSASRAPGRVPSIAGAGSVAFTAWLDGGAIRGRWTFSRSQ